MIKNFVSYKSWNGYDNVPFVISNVELEEEIELGEIDSGNITIHGKVDVKNKSFVFDGIVAHVMADNSVLCAHFCGR